MKEKILLTVWLILGVMLVVTMLIYSLDGELEIMENQDKQHLEHIEKESLR